MGAVYALLFFYFDYFIFNNLPLEYSPLLLYYVKYHVFCGGTVKSFKLLLWCEREGSLHEKGYCVCKNSFRQPAGENPADHINFPFRTRHFLHQ
jgi:hypothetical protein